jgi:type IV secretory pathway VirJ component
MSSHFTHRALQAVFATAALLASMTAGAEGPERDPFGKVRIVEPTGAMRGFVVLYSDAKGWDQNAEQAAQALGRDGALVVGVDLVQYRVRIDQGARKCGALVGDAEATSRDLQRARSYRDYHSPILAGIGAGGALAEAVLSAAPPATLAGAVSLDPRAPHTPMCGAAPPANASGKPLPGFWTVGRRSATEGLADRIAAAGSAVDVQRVPAKESPSVALADLVSRHLDSATPPTGVAKLPLIELPASAPSPLLAIIVSGDGGWRDLDKVIAEDLNRQGVSVVGWDSLRYFWTRKSPEETASDLAAVIETYAARWHAQKVALIGYSFGADVLPFLYNRLPRDDRQRVAMISLLALSQAADFEIKVNGWLGGDASEAALPTQPALASIDPRLIQCFYGEKEEHTQCPALATRGAETIHTTGGHHFDGNYAALAQRILIGFKARSGSGLR